MDKMDKLKENIAVAIVWVAFLALALCGVITVVMLDLLFTLIKVL